MKKISALVSKFLFLYLFITQSIFGENLIFDKDEHNAWLPVQYYLNSSFDVIQNPSWFSQDDYEKKHHLVWNRIKNPDKSIRRDGGYGKLIKDEVLTDRVLPNIGLHVLGVSYDTRLLNEYFEYHNVSYAPFWSLLLSYAGHLGNEALEASQTEEITSHDHIIDLFVFDAIGYALAFNDDFLKFMIDDMGMKTWHFQPSWDLKHDDVFNAGLNYIYRPKYFKGSVKPVLFTGMQNMVGASFYRGKYTYSLLSGVALTNPLKKEGRLVTGIYYEVEGRLSGSLLLNGSENYRWRLNLYPNVWKKYLPKKLDLAIVAGETSHDQLAFGLSLNMPFGLGIVSN